MIVAVDGPAGAGKSTVARLLAKKLGFSYLDTGAMYRAITVQVLQENVRPDDAEKVAQIARCCAIRFDAQGRVFLNDQNVSEAIRQPRVTAAISPVAANPKVRSVLAAQQRLLGADGDCVVEGRDTTTVVFPEAEYKFYLDAQVRERAVRRHNELKAKGLTVSLAEIEADVKKRDHADQTRSVGPLKKAEGSIYLDTTGLSIEDVVQKMHDQITKREKQPHGTRKKHP